MISDCRMMLTRSQAVYLSTLAGCIVGFILKLKIYNMVELIWNMYQNHFFSDLVSGNTNIMHRFIRVHGGMLKFKCYQSIKRKFKWMHVWPLCPLSICNNKYFKQNNDSWFRPIQLSSEIKLAVLSSQHVFIYQLKWCSSYTIAIIFLSQF